MTKLRWDQVGERLYEAGVDRGVLYLSDNTGVPWNGLISVEENLGEDTSEPAYFDGVKYNDVPSTGDYSASLTAFTYPDEFLDFEGITDLGNGLFVDGQDSKFFGLSYRTLVGNDIDGTEYGYKIHLIYNLTAVPSSNNYETLTDSPNPMQFGWNITGVPQEAPGYRPTAHVIFDSRFLKKEILSGIEDILYGDADSDALLPSIAELMDIVYFWGPVIIIPPVDEVFLDGGIASSAGAGLVNGGIASYLDSDVLDGRGVHLLTGIAHLVPGTGDLTMIKIDGLYTLLPTTRLVKTSIDGLSILVP